jgi:hypothetical protein
VDQDGSAATGLDGRPVSTVDESGDLQTIAVIAGAFATVPTHVVDDLIEKAPISVQAGNEAAPHGPTAQVTLDGGRRTDRLAVKPWRR